MVAIWMIAGSFKIAPLSIVLPSLYFEKNSTEYDVLGTVKMNEIDNTTSSWLKPKGIIEILAKIMTENEDIDTLEISGFQGFDESNDQNLSKKRTMRVKDDLVDLGISESRLSISVMGNENIMVPQSAVDTIKDIESQKIAIMRNRVVTFRLK